MTDVELTSLADKAAESAVMRILLRLGVDTTDPEAYANFRRDLAHLHAWRESVDMMKGATIKTAVAFIVVGFLGFLGMAAKALFSH